MMMMTRCQDHILTENIWFVLSKTSNSGDNWRCHGCGTDNRQTREDRALSQWAPGRLSKQKLAAVYLKEHTMTKRAPVGANKTSLRNSEDGFVVTTFLDKQAESPKQVASLEEESILPN